MLKECSNHGLTEFSNAKDRPRCKKCMVEAVAKRRKQIKLMAIEYKGGKCEHCGIVGSPVIYDFHHVHPEQKDFSISSKGHSRSWDKVKIELDKCLLLCSNCHRLEHERLLGERLNG